MAGTLVVDNIQNAAAETPFSITHGTQKTLTGTSVDFTGIPSWVKRITIMIDTLSTSATSIPIIQIGDSGGIETTGYTGGGWTDAVLNTNQTAGFGINGSHAAAYLIHGCAKLVLMNPSTNKWSYDWLGYSTSGAGPNIGGSGTKSLSATLDRIRITTVSGTDTFDSGTINIMYE